MPKALLFLFLISSTIFSFAQNNDTIYVYEYEYVTDTVWTEENNSERDLQKHDKLELLPIELTSHKSATILENNVYGIETKDKTEMKRITFLGLTFLALNTSLEAQEQSKDEFYLYLKGNLASQIQSYPDEGLVFYMDSIKTKDPDAFFSDKFNEKDYGRYQERSIPTMGLGIKYKHELNKNFNLIVNGGFIVRGSHTSSYESEYWRDGVLVSTEIIPKKTNRFYNFNTDILIKWNTARSRIISPYLYTGLRGDLNLHKTIEYQIDDHSPFSYSSYSGFNRFTYGIVNGVGISINKKLLLELELNTDIGYLVKNRNLKVRNHLVSFNIAYKLGDIPKYKLVRE